MTYRLGRVATAPALASDVRGEPEDTRIRR